MAAVGGIAERAEIGIVWRFDPHTSPRADQAMKLLHRLDHVGHVLDHVDRAQLVERAIRERIGETVEIADHVGFAGEIPVDPDGTGILADTAADV